MIIKDLKSNKIILYTKGADSIIEVRLSITESRSNNKIKTWEDLENYANRGLRTLVLAKREITGNEYNEWAKKY